MASARTQHQRIQTLPEASFEPHAYPEMYPAGVEVARERGQIAIESISVTYRTRRTTFTALERTSLTLEPACFAAFIGPSGCGKSTLLDTVAGFISPTTGSVHLDGAQILEPTPDIGMVFQNFALFPWFTAIGNVEFPLKRFGLPKKERRERALAALAEVGLADHAHKYPGQLSGGMKQRVAIARTLVSNPSALLMDEPFGALDAQTRLSMHELLLDLWEKHRQTVMFVTHDVNEALLLADVVYVMSAGPGRIIERIDVGIPRPRSVDRMDEIFLEKRRTILRLLRPGQPA